MNVKIFMNDGREIMQGDVVSLDYDTTLNLLVIMTSRHEILTLNLSLVNRYYAVMPTVDIESTE